MVKAVRWVVLGGLTIAVLDGLDAVVFFGFRGIAPIRIFQAIAAGLLGRASFQGGYPTAALGLMLHVVIATSIMAVYFTASGRWGVLVRRPLVCGAVYGLIVYGVMNYVVIPLSATGGGAKPWPVLLNGVLIHLLGVGPPAAMLSRVARAYAPRGARLD